MATLSLLLTPALSAGVKAPNAVNLRAPAPLLLIVPSAATPSACESGSRRHRYGNKHFNPAHKYRSSYARDSHKYPLENPQ